MRFSVAEDTSSASYVYSTIVLWTVHWPNAAVWIGLGYMSSWIDVVSYMDSTDVVILISFPLYWTIVCCKKLMQTKHTQLITQAHSKWRHFIFSRDNTPTHTLLNHAKGAQELFSCLNQFIIFGWIMLNQSHWIGAFRWGENKQTIMCFRTAKALNNVKVPYNRWKTWKLEWLGKVRAIIKHNSKGWYIPLLQN